MKFTTPVRITTSPTKLNHSHKIVAMGSCFADNIGQKLSQDGFNIAVNETGILFNPTSIEQLLLNAIYNQLDETLILQRDDLFYHFGFHSKQHAPSHLLLVNKLKANQNQLKENILNADFLILTFGTAWVYELIEQEKIVANCHKIKQSNFEKKMLSLQQLKGAYHELFETLKKLNPKLEIILTVSPVRHIKNGLHENNSSKATLHLLSDHLCEVFPFVNYFPAYELVNDELRDYRFFKEDMIHPTEQAVNFVYQKFASMYFDEATMLEILSIEKQRKLKKHINLTNPNFEV